MSVKSTSKKTARISAVTIRSGDDDGRAIDGDGMARGRVDLVDGHGAQQLRQPHVVIETQFEELGVLQEVGDRRVRFERARDGSDEESARLIELLLGHPFAREAGDLLVDRRDGTVDVRRTDAGPDDQRSFDDVRVEGARGVIRHPLTFADAVAEPPAERVLPEHVVHEPIRVVRRIAPRDRGEPVGDVGLRLVHHRDDTPAPRRRAADRWKNRPSREWLPPQPQNARRDVQRARNIDVADDRSRQRGRREALLVQAQHPVASSGSQLDPARIARWMATAGVIDARFASTTAPLSSTVLAGARPGQDARSTKSRSTKSEVRSDICASAPFWLLFRPSDFVLPTSYFRLRTSNFVLPISRFPRRQVTGRTSQSYGSLKAGPRARRR